MADTTFPYPDENDWWGNFSAPLFPANPPIGYVPPPPKPNPIPPVWTIMVLDNGFIGGVFTGGAR